MAYLAPTATPLKEYRGSELFSGLGAWTGVPPRQRIAEYRRALAVLQEVDAVVAHASIDKPRLAARHPGGNPNPHLCALQFLTEDVQHWIVQQTDPLSRRVLQVADENDEQEQDVIDLIDQMQALRGPAGEPRGNAIAAVRMLRHECIDPQMKIRRSRWP